MGMGSSGPGVLSSTKDWLTGGIAKARIYQGKSPTGGWTCPYEMRRGNTLLHYLELKCKSEAGRTDICFGGLEADWVKVRGQLSMQCTPSIAWIIGIFVNRATNPLTGHGNWAIKRHVHDVWLWARSELRTRYSG
jgi:hypothetical protein